MIPNPLNGMKDRSLSAADVAVMSLAAFRLTRLVAQDDLPPVKAARDRFIAWIGKDSSLVVEEAGQYQLCPWCVSVWVSFATVAAVRRWPHARRALMPWAISGAVGLLSTADSAMGRLGN